LTAVGLDEALFILARPIGGFALHYGATWQNRLLPNNYRLRIAIFFVKISAEFSSDFTKTILLKPSSICSQTKQYLGSNMSSANSTA
jgi:hypothetical protein